MADFDSEIVGESAEGVPEQKGVHGGDSVPEQCGVHGGATGRCDNSQGVQCAEGHTTKPLFCVATVYACGVVDGAVPNGSVFSLAVTVEKNAAPLPGQFFMLRSKKSQMFLARPISVFDARVLDNSDLVRVEFLVLKKGGGTKELCALEAGDQIELLGPCGRGFEKPRCSGSAAGVQQPQGVRGGEGVQQPQGVHGGAAGSPAPLGKPHSSDKPAAFADAVPNQPAPSQRVCLAGGGIGVAPIAGFAKTLPANSYDFYASFKSGSYGLQNLSPANLIVTTDDGSQGVHGMISAALNAQVLKEKNYSAVYACGPESMLRYIQKICKEAGVEAWLSLEARMACGMGVCLGCAINTTSGLKRCCKEGPVFNGEEIIFAEAFAFGGGSNASGSESPRNSHNTSSPTPHRTEIEKVDMSVSICSRASGYSTPSTKPLFLKNPVIAASGTFGFGSEYNSIFDAAALGGIASKGLTIEPRDGNSGIRIWETPSGVMNSIGLQNPGIEHFVQHELPAMKQLGTAVIANLSGSTLESYCDGARLLQASDVDAIELNISCPNVSKGGAAWGMTCSSAQTITQRIREITTKPLIVKLTPQADDIVAVVMGCVQSGADAISLCNSFQGLAIDIESGRPVFDKIKAGFGGPAIRPIALRLVYEVALAMKALPPVEQIPIIGIGGIATWRDAVEYIMAGASAVQVGSATFSNPLAMTQIISGIETFMKRKGYTRLKEMRGIAL